MEVAGPIEKKWKKQVKFTSLINNSPVVNEYLAPLLPQHQDLIGQCDHHPSYQEEPPPYDRAIQESSPFSKCFVTVTESKSEQKGSPPPEYHSLPCCRSSTDIILTYVPPAVTLSLKVN